MVYFIEIEVALLWSIKKETFMNKSSLLSKFNKTTIPGCEYRFETQQKDGYVAMYFADSNDMENSKIKEMTLTIPSANFKADLSKKADVPEDHYFYGWSVVAIKREDILNPEKTFFVDDILTLDFRGIVECNHEPNTETVGEMLWNAEEDKDFLFIIGIQQVMTHKFIIRRYSSVFSEMFNSNINQIEINGFSYFGVCYALQFCYDKPFCFSPFELLLECLRFANVYDMPVIKEKISNKMAEDINAKNVCKIANKSVEYNAPTLKDYCIHFISKCKRDGKHYDDALNLNIEIVHELYKSSVFRNETS